MLNRHISLSRLEGFILVYFGCDKTETNNVVLLPRERNYKFWDGKNLILRPLHLIR
jgi:hypothetical protein